MDTPAMHELREWAQALSNARSRAYLPNSMTILNAKRYLRKSGQYLTREELRRNGLILPFVRYEDYQPSVNVD